MLNNNANKKLHGLIFNMEVLKTVARINEFTATLDELTEESAKEIVELVKKNVGVLSIKVSHDGLSGISQAKDMQTDIKDGAIPNHVKLNGFSTVSDVVPGFKIMLSTVRHRADFSISMVRRCNGVILHVGEYTDAEGKVAVRCKPMVIPANDLTTKIDKRRINDYLKNDLYDIYMVNDGTTVNIYYDENYVYSETLPASGDGGDGNTELQRVYHRGDWLFSTKNASNIGSMMWRGSTYGAVIYDALRQYKDFSLERLDKNKSYTIGFKHPAHHPFGQPREWDWEKHYSETVQETDAPEDLPWIKEAWFIQSADLVTGKTSQTEDIGLPLQRQHTLAEFAHAEHADPVNENTEDYFQNILGMAHRSMQKYSQAYKMNLLSEEDMREDPPIFLGVFLRSRDESVTTQFSDVLIESTLWTSIRHAIYQKPFIANRELREKQGQSFKNFTYVILDAYLNFKKNKEFIMLFPQFQHYYDRMQSVIDEVTNAIFNSMKQNGNAKLSPESEWLYNRFYDIVNNVFQAKSAPGMSGATGRGRRGGRGRGRGGRGRGERGSSAGEPGIASMRVTIGDKKIIRDIMVNPKYTEIYFEGLYV
jgi:hypothetical protein